MSIRYSKNNVAKYGKLLGIRNTIHQDSMKKEAMESVVNFDHGDGGSMERRDGYSLAASLTNATDLYSPVMAEGLYAVDNGVLKSFSDSLVPTSVATGLTDTVMNWAEMDGRVAYAGLVDAGIILNRSSFVPLRVPVPAGVQTTPISGDMAEGDYIVAVTYTHIATGVSGGATMTTCSLGHKNQGIKVTVPQITGYMSNFYVSSTNDETPYWYQDGSYTVDLSQTGYRGLPLDPEQREGIALPAGIVALTSYANRLYAATYDSASDVSTVMWSGVFYPHLWALHSDWMAVRGKVLALCGTKGGLLIGTTDRIFLHDGESLQTLAEFGVIPGRPFAQDKSGATAIWTQRGVCVFPEFKAAQIEKVSVAPGSTCTTAAIERRGRKQFIAVTDGLGTAWNNWS